MSELDWDITIEHNSKQKFGFIIPRSAKIGDLLLRMNQTHLCLCRRGLVFSGVVASFESENCCISDLWPETKKLDNFTVKTTPNNCILKINVYGFGSGAACSDYYLPLNATIYELYNEVVNDWQGIDIYGDIRKNYIFEYKNPNINDSSIIRATINNGNELLCFAFPFNDDKEIELNAIKINNPIKEY